MVRVSFNTAVNRVKNLSQGSYCVIVLPCFTTGGEKKSELKRN